MIGIEQLPWHGVFTLRIDDAQLQYEIMKMLKYDIRKFHNLFDKFLR